jgi:hypothetical protein
MRFLAWLFGTKEREFGAARPGPRASAPAAVEKPAATLNPEGERRPPEADNLRRWQESGQARAWVEAHQGRWDHDDWLALLEELRRSPFWPLQQDAVGRVLEELKLERLGRN